MPAEGSRILVLLQLREGLRTGRIRRAWWCHAGDMLADAITKGAVSRNALIQALETIRWDFVESAVSSLQLITGQIANRERQQQDPAAQQTLLVDELVEDLRKAPPWDTAFVVPRGLPPRRLSSHHFVIDRAILALGSAPRWNY